MNKPSTYIVSVLLTLLMIFSGVAAAAANIAQFCALDTETALSLVESQNLPARVKGALETAFHERANTTGIPETVFADSITEEQLSPIIRNTITNGFAYIRGETASLGTVHDFSVLEENLNAFFSDYADENGIEKDAVYDEAVARSIESAESLILSSCDVFRISTLGDAGILRQAQRIAPYLIYAALGTWVVVAVLILLLWLTNREAYAHTFYWTGTASVIIGLLMLIPASWLQTTNWFDRFAIKTDQTFAAITGYLYSLTQSAIQFSIVLLALGIVLFIVFAILHIRSTQKEALKKAKH